MKTILPAMVMIVLLLGSSTTPAEPPANQPAPDYEKTLYDLGAFPVAKLTKPYFTNGNPGKVYSKGDRIDVDGWIPPFWTDSYLTDAEKAKYGIPKKPLTYDQYMKLLDIDTYKRTHDSILFLVMRFTLENMHWAGMPLKREDFFRVYEARIGLEEWAVPLAKGKLSSKDVMYLLQKYGDERVFALFPAPKATDKMYVSFLEEQANNNLWSISSRLTTHKLLFSLDKTKYRKPYEDFLLTDMKTAKEWWERANLYDGLIELKDDESWNAVRYGLVHDPVTEVRESILYSLKEQGEVAPTIDAILVVVNGKDDKHMAETAGRMAGQWSYMLNEYLTWAKSIKTLDAVTAKKVKEAAEKLSKRGE